ncbi:MAG TPA: N-acetyl-gamma-glutamyl-phosphate reductase [Clostridiales bacterium]|nr:N-acetyl-gamma-glutamyl-phosphate reductase [Clostridiales bacterium]
MIKVGIIGATGYAGQELVRLLMGHKDVTIKYYSSKSYVGKRYDEVYPNMLNIVGDICVEDNLVDMAKEVDVIFTATPHAYISSLINEDILSNAKVIDLSADFRLNNQAVFEKWYNIKHESFQFVEEAVYGLSEIYRDDIKNARLIANPGCYPTCSILSLYPLLKEGLVDKDSIIIDAKSGVSGAGRSVSLNTIYCEVNESMKAYGISTHRHAPEIEEQLSMACGNDIAINFTPHLVPMNRGIYTTAYANLLSNYSYDEVKEIYNKYYKNENFIRILEEGVYPETKWVEASNYMDINFKIDNRTNRIIVVSAIDNLVKGAAGQAVQNMNIMFGLKENEGLNIVPIFP